MHTIFAFLGGLGGWEILLILLVLLIFFGAKRIPELARGLGKGIKEFKDATNEIKDEITKEEERPAPEKKVPTERPVSSTVNENKVREEKP